MKRAFFLIFLLTLAISGVQAQATLSHITPVQVTAGTSSPITVYGTGFTAAAQVFLNAEGPLTPNSVSADGLNLVVTVPPSLAAGVYTVRVVDGVADEQLNNALTIVAPTATPTLTPTLTPTATPTTLPTNTPVPTISINRSEPEQAIMGTAVTISVLGTNFTADTVVRVNGVGLLATTFLHAGAVTAVLPESALAGQYAVEVIDPTRGTAVSPQSIRIVAPPPPTQPPAPTEPPPPTLTPIPVANEPVLAIDSINTQSGVVAPGGTINLSFTVYNRGNQTARNVVVSLTSGAVFLPAVGQANLNMPDIPAGGAATATLRINAADNAPQGPALIPLGISYRDIEGKSYEGKTEVGIRVQIVSQSAQIVLESYHIEPQMVVPGGPIIINATFVNMGTKPATQVMVRVTGGENILLPDSRGDSFSVGNLQPSESRTVQLPLIVNSAAKEGPQLQPLTVTYLEDGEAKESAASLTVPVGKVDLPVPLLLLVSYDTGQTDDLRPGDRFTLKVVLSNVASADAQDTLVTFGTVQSSGTDTSGGGNGGGQQTDTTSPSTTFAPQGNAGRTFIGAFPANSTTEITQEFIVSGSVNSGIYNLPITLQYLLPDNTVKQDVLNVSLVVIAPVRLRINPPQPMPEFVNAGDVVPISLELVNYGKNSINLLSASFSATNAEVMDGAEIPLETLNADGDTSVSGMVMPLEEGEMDVTFTLNYLDDLNQPRTLELTFNAVVEAPIPIIDDGGIDFPPIIEPTPEPDNNWLGRAIMALLGLGS